MMTSKAKSTQPKCPDCRKGTDYMGGKCFTCKGSGTRKGNGNITRNKITSSSPQRCTATKKVAVVKCLECNREWEWERAAFDTRKKMEAEVRKLPCPKCYRPSSLVEVRRRRRLQGRRRRLPEMEGLLAAINEANRK